MFGARGVRRRRASAQEFWRGARARRAMSGDALPVAVVSLVRRNRRRYGGYLVHVGHGDAVRRRRRLVGVPARPRRAAAARARRRASAATTSATCAPTGADRDPRRAARAHRARRGARRLQGRQARPDARRRRAATTRRRRRSRRSAACSPASRPARSRMTRGLRRDVWTAVQPDLGEHPAADGALRPHCCTKAAKSPGCSDDQAGARLPRAAPGRRRPLSAGRPAGDVPAHRLAAGRVDLDRRPDRLRRRRSSRCGRRPTPRAAGRPPGYAARVAQELGRA